MIQTYTAPDITQIGGFGPEETQQFLEARGLSKAQLMELVMFAQMQAGMRGLQHVNNAVGRYLPDWSDGPGEVPLPNGWAADPDAFKAGLDLSSRELTGPDRAA